MSRLPDESTAPYLDALLEYRNRGPARFHVPGHKGGSGVDRAYSEAVGPALALDIPRDINGIDVGPFPTPYEQAELLAAAAHGAARTWFLSNGATQGNHALTLSMAPLGAHVMVQRNSHGSLVDGLVLSGGLPVFIGPAVDSLLQIAHGVLPETLDQRLAEAPEVSAVFIVSPTYYGTCADVAGLAGVAHDAGVALAVDQSWGPHFGFHPDLPQSALQLGADAVLTSTHKIAGSLTQSAMLHVAKNSRVSVDTVDRAMRLVRSTSPNSLLLGSLDAARRNLVVHGRELLDVTLAAVKTARARIESTDGLELLDAELLGRPGIHDFDPLKLVVDVRGTGNTGYAFAGALRETGDISVELATESVIVLIVGVGEKPESLESATVNIERVATAMQPATAVSPPIDATSSKTPELVVSPREAFLRPGERVAFAESAGRICCESIAVYPPGIPSLLPGERIIPEIVEHLRTLVSQGARLHGASDPLLKTIRVLPQ